MSRLENTNSDNWAYYCDGRSGNIICSKASFSIENWSNLKLQGTVIKGEIKDEISRAHR